MRRPVLLPPVRAACLAVSIVVMAAGAQSPATRAPAMATGAPAPIPLTAIPTTPAGDALRAWFDAFNSGDSTRMEAFLKTYASAMQIDAMIGFRFPNDLWTRHDGSTEEFWTRDSVPGRRFGGTKPVFVLTSSRTFSGAEEFANDLKTLKRATIIGETTGGGAHPVRGRRIDDHFFINVPYARAIDPVTKTNWEGVGVEPDVRVEAGKALEEAIRRAGESR